MLRPVTAGTAFSCARRPEPGPEGPGRADRAGRGPAGERHDPAERPPDDGKFPRAAPAAPFPRRLPVVHVSLLLCNSRK
ncbi:hypothetical protein VULLAG_LOCUS13723 [Vulpes lagopus]